jgi:hypothetical protein
MFQRNLQGRRLKTECAHYSERDISTTNYPTSHPRRSQSPYSLPEISYKIQFVFIWAIISNRSWDSSVGIAMDYGLDGQGSIPDRARLSLLHSIQTSSGTHPASCTMGTRGKVAEARS